MKGERTLEKVLLALIAAATIITAVSVREIARNGVSMEITVEDIEAARAAFEQDLAEETE